MNFINCYHPRVVRNQFTGEEITISCGHCKACLNNRALTMTTRCDMETSSHRYCVYATLTYSDYDVPQLVRLRQEHCQIKGEIIYLDGSTGEFFSFMDKSIRRHSKKDREYCFNTKVLPVLSKPDVQKFIKLLRYYANEIEKNIRLRYCICGEYGETTFRPHYHLLLWFDSDIIAQHYKEIICKAWRHGYVYDPHLVSGTASSYVASYINGYSRLPSIYTHKKLRPFLLYSKNPSLGSLCPSVPSLQEFFDNSVSKVAFCPPASKSFVDVTLWRSLLDRYTPRIQRFSSISVSDRISLYRLVEQHHFEDANKFAEFLYYRYVRSNRITFVSRYLYDICHKSVLRKKFSRDGRLTTSSEFELATCVNSLVHFCQVLFRAKLNSQFLGISLSDFVTKMSQYYDNLDKEKFKEYMDYQNEYFKNHPVRDYLLFDYTFVNRVNGKHFDLLSASDQHYLRLCGVVDDATDVVSLTLDDCLEYHSFVARNNLLAEQLTKKKVQFDYVLSQGDNYNNIKNYFSQ